MNDSYSQLNSPVASAPLPAGFYMGYTAFWIIILVISVIAMWKIYSKAGQPGWASLVPFYNLYIFLKIIGRPGWWILLYLIPFVNIVISLINAIDLAKVFGRSTIFGVVALWLFPYVGYLMLAFGSSKYEGVAAQTQPASGTPQAPTQKPTPPSATPPQPVQ